MYAAVAAPAPQDSWIAYSAASPDGDTALFVTTPDGSRFQLLGGSPAGQAVRAWSRDGAGLVFCDRVTEWASIPASECLEHSAISASHLPRALSTSFLDTTPRLSVDGRTFAYVQIHDAVQASAAVVTHDLVTGRHRVVVGFDANVGPDLDWSPDGSTLAYSSRPRGALAEDLWLVARDGSGAAQLTRLPPGWSGSRPTFSPDGRRIAFRLDDPHGHAAIAVIGADGRGLVRLMTFTGLSPVNLDWGPVRRAR